MMSQEAGKLVVVWLSRHAALLLKKGGALRDETITAAKETPMVVSSPEAGELRISSDSDDRRIFGGLKFSILVRKIFASVFWVA